MTDGYPYAPLHNDSPVYPSMPLGGISISPFLPSDPQPTVWLTVKGPAPYTKLAVVHEVTQYGDGFDLSWDGSLSRFSDNYKTSLVYPNYRSDSPPLYRHSTTISLYQLWRADGTWTVAVDQVNTCFFDDGGIWTLNLNFAHQFQGDSSTGWQGSFFRVSSWVLLTDPDI